MTHSSVYSSHHRQPFLIPKLIALSISQEMDNSSSLETVSLYNRRRAPRIVVRRYSLQIRKTLSVADMISRDFTALGLSLFRKLHLTASISIIAGKPQQQEMMTLTV
jgi:hypothetical protein